MIIDAGKLLSIFRISLAMLILCVKFIIQQKYSVIRN